MRQKYLKESFKRPCEMVLLQLILQPISPLVNGFPKLRFILSALNTRTFFVHLLRHLTSNEFILKNSFEFAKII